RAQPGSRVSVAGLSRSWALPSAPRPSMLMTNRCLPQCAWLDQCKPAEGGGAVPEAGRQPHASARQARTTFSGEQSLTQTSAGFGNRVLVGDPLHNSSAIGEDVEIVVIPLAG